jgi:hypothetical protein
MRYDITEQYSGVSITFVSCTSSQTSGPKRSTNSGSSQFLRIIDLVIICENVDRVDVSLGKVTESLIMRLPR